MEEFAQQVGRLPGTLRLDQGLGVVETQGRVERAQFQLPAVAFQGLGLLPGGEFGLGQEDLVGGPVRICGGQPPCFPQGRGGVPGPQRRPGKTIAAYRFSRPS